MDSKALHAALSAPFPLDALEWRPQTVTSGRALMLCYVTNRAIMDRLDAAVGCMYWRNEYRPSPDGGGILCGISVWDDNRSEWVPKWDGAPPTKVEAVKGGLSSAMKRAAVQWGIGRYLYRLPTTWVNLEDGWANGRGIDVSDGRKHAGWCKTPRLPSWALPAGPAPAAQPETQAAQDERTHPSWQGSQRGFFAMLKPTGFTYEEVCFFCENLGRPRPSGMSEVQRSSLLAYITGDGNEKMRQAAEFCRGADDPVHQGQED